ncbi:MAG: phage terminase small subunit-related protein, partial [Turicibacter sp.]
MARERSPNRDKAKTLYLSANGEIKLTDIAAQLNVSDSQIRKWKSTDKWDNELNGALPKENGKVKGNVTNKKVTEKKIKKEPIELVNGENVDNPTGSDLTEKQWLFCLYYTQLFNATKAYQKAYGCKYETAMVEGCKHLRKPKIIETIKELKKERLAQSLLTTEDI